MNNTTTKMGMMDIKKLILRMSFPAMISMLVQALYNIVDSIFVARISEKALTSLSIVFPIQLVIVAIFVGLGVGVNSFMARKLGEENKDTAVNAAEHGLAMGLALGILLAISSIFVPEVFIKLFTDDPVVLKGAVTYTRIIMLFSFGSILSEICMNILRATGDMVSSMKIQLLGAITNIILDPILIFGLFFFPKMGIKGAAIATVIGQLVAMSFAFILVIHNKNGLKLHIRKFHFKANISFQILKVGGPAMVMQMTGPLMISGINLILAGFSATAIAVFGVYFKLQSFIYMPLYGLTQGVLPIVAYNYGAKDRQRVITAIKYGCLYGGMIMLFGTALFQLFPKQLLFLFNSTAKMNSLGIVCLRTISIGFVFSGVAIVLAVVFQAFGNAKESLVIYSVRQLIALLPLAFLLSNVLGLFGVWIAFPLAEAVSLLIAVLYIVKTYKKKL